MDHRHGEHHAGPDRWYRPLAAAACALALAAGCASRGPKAQEPRPPQAGPAAEPAEDASLAPLIRAAAEETARPNQRTLSAPPPPGLDPALAEVIPTVEQGGDPKARMPLADVVPLLAKERPAAGAATPASPADAERALRHYVTGRQKLLEDDAAGAAAELREATRLDPSAGEPWRALGEALLRAGARTEAVEAFRSAEAAGLEDARVLEVLARDALDRSDTAAAAKLLARASLASPERLDPVLPLVIDVSLSRALTAGGYIAAARDALARAGERPMVLSASTRYGPEFGAIFRRQAEIWRDIGDACCRLGEYARALDAYERSAELPTLDETRITPRIVFAAMRAGRPAAAALAVMRDIIGSPAVSAARDRDMLRYVAANGGNGDQIASALAAFLAAQPQPVAPSLEGSLTRARAAIARPVEARTILRKYVAQNPEDLRAAGDLLRLLPGAAAAASEATDLASGRPSSATSIAEALLRSEFAYPEIAAALARTGPRPAADLVLAYMLARRGEYAKAAERVATIEAGGRWATAASLARVQIGVEAGRPDLIRSGLDRLKEQRGVEADRASAKALLLLQRCRAGLAAADSLLRAVNVPTADRVDDLALAASLALAVGEGDKAEQWLRQAAALDPADDRPLSALLTIYGSGGIKADPAKLNGVVRELRERTPEGRTLRTARAQDLLRRSMFAQCEEDAAALAAEDPLDSSAVDLLVASWLRRPAAEKDAAVVRGRAWLETQLARRPYAPPLMAGTAALLVGAGQAGEAETFLRRALDESGGPDVSRLLERVLRAELKRGDEANTMALRRLEGREHTPGEAIELAEVYTLLKRETDAAASLRAGLPPEVSLSGKQELQLLALAGELAERAGTGEDPAKRAAAVGALDLAAGSGLMLDPETHERRLILLARTPDADADRLYAAAALTAKQHPSLAQAAFVRASQGLTLAQRAAPAVAFISRAAKETASPGLDLFIEWFRVVSTVGVAAQARELIETAERAGRLRELVDRVAGPAEGAPPRNDRAEAAYALGNYMSAGQRDTESMAAYELALEFDPKHAWASNNLGYALADRGEQLERASALLEFAHAALPDETSVTDSLGWLRYKQGIMEDQIDQASGVVKVRGAVTLLQEAANTERGRVNPTILDHLADALWRAGRREEAIRYWELAEARAGQGIRASARIAQAGQPGQDGERQLTPGTLEEYRKIRDSAAAKRRAARAGEAVGVAPLLGEAAPPRREPAKPDAAAPGLIPVPGLGDRATPATPPGGQTVRDE